MARYVGLLVYQEHFTLNGLISTLNEFKAPYVISPLHTPSERKAHYHIILDNTETDFNDNFLRCICSILKTPNTSYIEIKSIRSAELYLKHETADSANKQQFKFSDPLTFGFGYQLHQNTYVGKREEVQHLVTYISDKLVLYCRSVANVTFMDLWDLVKKPDFFEECDTFIPFKSCVSKALNEVKLHFRFYQSVNEQASKMISDQLNALDQFECNEVSNSLTDYLLDTLVNLSDQQANKLIYDLYSNNKKFRDRIKACGGLHTPKPTLQTFIKKLVDVSEKQLVVDYIEKFGVGTNL